MERFNNRVSDILHTHFFESKKGQATTLRRYTYLYNHHIPQRPLEHKSPSTPSRSDRRSCNYSSMALEINPDPDNYAQCLDRTILLTATPVGVRERIGQEIMARDDGSILIQPEAGRALPWGAALAISLAVHGAALGWLLHERLRPATASLALSVHLQAAVVPSSAPRTASRAPIDPAPPAREPVRSTPALPEPAPAVTRPAHPRPKPVHRRPAPGRSAPQHTARAASAPRRRQHTTHPPAPTAHPVSQAAAHPVSQAAAHPTPAPANATAATPARPAARSDLLARYRARIRALIAAQQYYPIRARRRQLEGTVTVGFTLTRAGRLEDLAVVRSSGHPSLDRAALNAVRKVAGFPPFPAGLDHPRWRFELPMRYALR